MVSLAATLSVAPDRSRREMANAVNPAIGRMPKGADAMTLNEAMTCLLYTSDAADD